RWGSVSFIMASWRASSRSSPRRGNRLRAIADHWRRKALSTSSRRGSGLLPRAERSTTTTSVDESRACVCPIRCMGHERPWRLATRHHGGGRMPASIGVPCDQLSLPSSGVDEHRRVEASPLEVAAEPDVAVIHHAYDGGDGLGFGAALCGDGGHEIEKRCARCHWPSSLSKPFDAGSPVLEDVKAGLTVSLGVAANALGPGEPEG